MGRRFQFSLRMLLAQMTLASVGVALLVAAFSASGMVWSHCLYMLAAAPFGAIIGTVVSVWTGRPHLCAAVFAGYAMPLSLLALPFIWFAAEIMARIVR
jgi:hypothetical protein